MTPLHIGVLDASNTTLRISIRASGGTLVAAGPANGGVPRVASASGTPRQINAFLQSLAYRPAKDSTRTETLAVTAANGSQTSTRNIQVSIRAVNDPPLVTAHDVSWSNDGRLTWDGPVLSDPDSTRISVSIRTNRGLVRIADPAARTASGTTTIDGDIEHINRLLATPGKVSLAGPFDGAARITIRVSDGWLTTERLMTPILSETLQEHAIAAVESRLAGQDPSRAKPIFSVADHERSRYERNPGSWASGLDLTCISPWNNCDGNYRAGTLVSPRHIVYASHFGMPVGTMVRFVARDNTVYERTIVGTKSLTASGPSWPDITVAVLDRDLPDTIGFARILPDDWNRYLPGTQINIPCLALDQEEKALVTDLFLLNDYASFVMPDKEIRKAFFEPLIWGDSGNPGFMIVADQLVLIAVWTSGWAGSGTSIAYYKAQINQVMRDLGGGYQLTDIDLSRFQKI